MAERRGRGGTAAGREQLSPFVSGFSAGSSQLVSENHTQGGLLAFSRAIWSHPEHQPEPVTLKTSCENTAGLGGIVSTNYKVDKPRQVLRTVPEAYAAVSGKI